MKLVPHVVADFDEYPELRTLGDAALRRIAELMSIHAIVEIRRLHKTGVFDHPYTKDIITPLDLPVVPHTVRAGQHAAGKALLDYLESIGISGLRLEVAQEDVNAMASLWMPPSAPQPEQHEPAEGDDGLNPKPAEQATPEEEQPAAGPDTAASEQPVGQPAEGTNETTGAKEA